MMNQLYSLVIKHRNQLVLLFQLCAIGQVFALLVGFWGIVLTSQLQGRLTFLGVHSGEFALAFFVLTTLPGIWRRFGIFNKLISILMIFRRYIGIMMYLFALIHFSFLRFFPSLAGGRLYVPSFTFLFEVFGFLTILLLLFLFVTSNDLSVSKLGDWWGRIHKLTYVCTWFIFLHTVLLRWSIWSIIIGVTAIFQVISFIVAKKRLSVQSTTTSMPTQS